MENTAEKMTTDSFVNALLQPREHRDLLLVDAMPRESYERLSLVRLTVYSIHLLAQWEIPTTYENISVLNGRLFPSKFSLAGFPEMPDAMRTNREILKLRPKYRGFATSDPRKGVFLTEKGRIAAANVFGLLGVPSLEGKPVEGRAVEFDYSGKGRERTRNPHKIIAECKSRLLFRWFKEDRFEEADVVHLLGLVSLYDHTPAKEVRKAFRELRADAQTISDAEFLGFLDSVETLFAPYLNRKEQKNKRKKE